MVGPQRPGWTGRRAVAVTLGVAAALLISACADSGYHYLKNNGDDTGTYFKVPDSWKIYDESEFFRSRDLSPTRTKIEKDTSWTVAFDSSAKPTLKHFDQVATSHPFGLAQVRELDPEERDTFSLESMRNAFVRVDALAEQGAEVEPLGLEEITESGGFHGLRFTFELKFPDANRYVTFDQATLVDSATKELHLLVISCSSRCYEREKGTIDTVIDSWTVKER